MIEMELLASLPWPRGLCFADGLLFSLGRGRPRGAGGPDPTIDDKAGTIFEVSQDDGDVTHRHQPTAPPFRLWDREIPVHSDIETDRPYAGLVWHPASRNFFICGFSGIDRPSDSVSFRKNATDAVIRFDARTEEWHDVERHEASVVPEDLRRSLTTSIPNEFFPSSNEATPRGWLNGPDGLLVHDNFLFAVGKDNHSVIRYDLTPLLDDPDQGPLEGTVLRIDSKNVDLGQGAVPMFDGPSCLATDGTTLYVGLRTTGVVLGFPIGGPYDSAHLIAQLPGGAGLIDIAMGPFGELHIASKRKRVWNIGVPSPDSTYIASDDNVYAQLPGNCSNIALDHLGRLYVCCNVNDGAIFRALAVPGTNLV